MARLSLYREEAHFSYWLDRTVRTQDSNDGNALDCSVDLSRMLLRNDDLLVGE